MCNASFTAQQWPRLASIAGDVESLAMYGASSTVITTAGQSGELLAGDEATEMVHGINDDGLAALAGLKTSSS